MPLAEGAALLRGRYELGTRRSAAGDAEAWTAYDEDGVQYLARTWAYDGDEPDPVQRALWDAELRTLYRVGSSPGADDTLAVLKDAGLDRDAKSFVMVLQATGYDSVADALAARAEHGWLSSHNPADRRELWRAAGRVAAGLAVLHSQDVLHRDVGAAALLYLPDEPAESIRLGGFEWSVRLGRPLDADPPVSWSSPPERLAGDTAAWRPDDDWFGFGMLCARLVLNLERYANNAPTERYARVVKAIEAARTTLTEPERALLLRLIDPEPLERMTRPHDVQLSIRGIVALLAAPPAARADDRPFTLIVDPKQVRLYDYLLERGLREHLGLDDGQPYDPRNVAHTDGLAVFLRRDLDGGSLYAVPKQETVLLVGRRTVVRLRKYSHRDEAPTWQIAFCVGPAQLTNSEGGAARVRLPAGRLAVRSTRAAHNDRGLALASATWDTVLPRIERGADLARDLAQFHQFVRATHQIELLMLDATIFPIELVAGPDPADDLGFEQITVRERPRPENRQVLAFLHNDDLAGFLQRELEAGKPDSGSVILSGERGDALALPAGGKDNQWRVHAVDDTARTATLRRQTFDTDRPSPPDNGYLRGAGMPGQLKLIRRRKQAIDALDRHSYLLRSLAAPGQVYIDTGAADLPVRLAPETVDEAKRRAIEDILRVRPIYALQGPPGTGKTTLVAWLLREILHDDPVAQVLVTAQAHGAVDVLRARVTEAFKDVAPERRPLAVRLGSRRDDDTALDTVEDVALQVLRDSSSTLAGLSDRTPAQQDWLDHATAMADELASHEARGTGAADFVELVKRGANLTYCTTSAGELEAIAGDQSFDWSIVEEAGKAHGFDLALPLQAGHRWLLIGDHNQLPPYRYEDYLRGVDALDEVVEALQALPDTGPGVLDWEWVSSWKDKTTEERAAFQSYAKDWLKTFKRTFEHCQVAVGQGDAGQRLTDDSAGGAAAGVLIEQHRMHPDIGELISRAYYGDRLVNRTVQEGRPIARVLHGFAEPLEICGKAIVWLDVPWCRDEPRTAETGPAQGRPRYTNDAEAKALANFLASLRREASGAAELAVLSPYNQQASLLRRRMKKAALPEGLELKPALNARPGAPGGASGVHTVDSFQGNQADVIAVSLVRNNLHDPGHGLGFLDDASRLNVLLSRAERLLVLVGSWDFFREQVSTVELDDTANPLWHLKRIVTDLSDWFASGRAVRLGADLGGLS
ncbi:Protein kinase domain-containing protein [Actinokineospora alba]|uniref:Protein kinase domain-containing protein n=1 Tax=Actinokineospora alba TaxID=504798 RepID=A0A1H0TQS2_9PSEU|nr:AAA domain-containing protein [Actinokineospora alba]TDP70660.1 protein kinase-like protein [Actinokineospora alba]SDJ12915.1 Protein kinase domain-containing protein [Actinokineospora alba]SDP56273.1 Protein kinase domain-containing protein [Actinokineospora alba]